MYHILVFAILVHSAVVISNAQQNYVLKHERAVLVSYNSSLVTKDVEFSFKKINRTSFAFNASFTLLRDILDEEVMMHGTADKKIGNEYRRFGVDLKTNLCKFFSANSFGIKEDVAKYGNIEACHIVKKYYYIRNFIPDSSKYPKYLPLGSYRINFAISHHGVSLFVFQWYVSIENNVKW